MSDKERLLDFLTDVNKLNKEADPDLHYTMLWLQGEKHLIEQDMEMRGGNAKWAKDDLYHYGLNYKFDGDKLTELYLSAMNLTVIPDTIKNLIHLKKINLSNNNIGHIPEELELLTNIEDVNFSNNLLKSVPEAIPKLPKLRRVKLSNNSISSLPDLTALKNLRELDISDNKFQTLPNEALFLAGNGVELISGK